jgi:hypothetical protein
MLFTEQEKRSHGILGHKYEDNIKTEFKGTESEDVD